MASSSSPIKTIIFDLGGVIVPFDFSRAYSRLETLSGLSRDEIRQKLTGDGFSASFERGDVTPPEFLAEFNRRLSTRLAMDEFAEIWVSIFSLQTLVSEALIASLAARYRVILLSNTNQTHYEWIARTYPHLGHMHHHVLSYQVRAMKPDPAIYAAAIGHAHCRASECFFTDDVLPYVEGARAAGIDAVQFTGEPALRAHLAERGIIAS